MSEATVERIPKPVVVFRHELDRLEDQFKAALPAHMPVERFMRVVVTAVQNNPELMDCERRSLWNAAMRAAQDGLLPDGREGAMVVRLDRSRGKIVVWQPMFYGIQKKVRNSGELAGWQVHEVYERDTFRFQLGDAPMIEHSYDLRQERGELIGAYSIAILRDGTKLYDVMSRARIEKVRNKTDAWKAFVDGKIRSTPWAEWPDEMYKKTVARHHSKMLPMSSDLDDLIRRDDELYDHAKAREEAQVERPHSLRDRLNALAAGLPSPEAKPEPQPEGDEQPEPEGELEPAPETFAPNARARARKSKAEAESPKNRVGSPPAGKEPEPAPDTDPLVLARQRGAEAKRAGAKRSATPGEYRIEGREAEATAWREGWETEWNAERDREEAREQRSGN